MKYLMLAIHYPKPENRKDILGAMNQLAQEAQKTPGLIEMSAWIDEKTDRIFAVALWKSKEEGMACWQKLAPLAAQFPLADWERQPREVLMNLVQGD
ncbi:MAG: hypothetical protein ACYC8S_02695 [Minisyncoccota bacterium]